MISIHWLTLGAVRTRSVPLVLVWLCRDLLCPLGSRWVVVIRFRWVSLGPVPSRWVLLGPVGSRCRWVPLGPVGSSWVPFGPVGFCWVLLGPVGYCLVPLGWCHYVHLVPVGAFCVALCFVQFCFVFSYCHM